MTNEQFDSSVERELQRRFAEADRGVDDTDTVLASLRPSMQRARRNRRVLTGSVAALSIAVLVVVGLAAFSSGERSTRVHVPPATRSPGAPTTSTITSPGGSSGQDGSDAKHAPDVGAPPPSTPPPAPAADVPTATTEPAGADTSPPVTSPDGDTPYSSPGGSIVVRRTGDTISLASSTPASGFTQEVHDNGPTRVEVRFASGGTEWRIRVDLVNGQLVAETTEHG